MVPPTYVTKREIFGAMRSWSGTWGMVWVPRFGSCQLVTSVRIPRAVPWASTDHVGRIPRSGNQTPSTAPQRVAGLGVMGSDQEDGQPDSLEDAADHMQAEQNE